MKSYRWYPTVLLLLIIPMVLWTGCDSTDAMDDGFAVEGQVLNATERPVRGATVSLSGGSQTVTTNDEGRFTLTGVSEGEYTLTYEADGYQDATASARVASEDLVLDPVRMQGPATITGSVVDSQTGEGTPDATVIFVRQENTNATQRAAAEVGDDEIADLVVETDEDGAYTIQNAPTGQFRLVIRRDGYAEDRVENVVVEEGENEIDPRPISEELAEGELRIVLSWGESPSDLDSHLTGPLADEGRFHVYFANRTPTSANANLDRDDTTSYGPETITVTALRDGLYRYSVHNFSNQSDDGAVGIYESPAEVRFYNEDGLVDVYSPLEAESGDGNTWLVFEFTVDSGNVTLDDGNGATLGYDQASSSGDTSTFARTDAGKPPVSSDLF
ncbi:hypothetical protein CRI93_05745 [Longimonas halophila]|uniref:Carboxypeptidase regulatory-like domain-containing protein n=1 Tax=Longimonas halophila TaxID=1469170 RepID=A0A2H3NYR9_9BACT|nr:carboxypeptidase regulatory-like domain-containing protein [Longimonas halophila]PEN07947.1 hypothetical protein CRI93_05745 [Longimonas halophila]